MTTTSKTTKSNAKKAKAKAAAKQDKSAAVATPLILDPQAKLIFAALDDLATSEAKVGEAKLVLKDHQTTLDATRERFTEAVRDARYGPGPLFKGNGEAKPGASLSPVESNKGKGTGLGYPCPPDKSADDEGWRLINLVDLDKPSIAPAVLKCLANNSKSIKTLGDLADWQEAKGDFWAVDISGIGQAAQDKIADATDGFHVRRAKAIQQEIDTAKVADAVK